MSDVINLPTAHSEVKRLDAINWAITDLMALSDLLGMANATVDDQLIQTRFPIPGKFRLLGSVTVCG